MPVFHYPIPSPPPSSPSSPPADLWHPGQLRGGKEQEAFTQSGQAHVQSHTCMRARATPPRLLPLGGVKEDGRSGVSGIDSRAGNRCEAEPRREKSGIQSEVGKLYILCIPLVFFFSPFSSTTASHLREAWQRVQSECRFFFLLEKNKKRRHRSGVTASR